MLTQCLRTPQETGAIARRQIKVIAESETTTLQASRLPMRGRHDGVCVRINSHLHAGSSFPGNRLRQLPGVDPLDARTETPVADPHQPGVVDADAVPAARIRSEQVSDQGAHHAGVADD